MSGEEAARGGEERKPVRCKVCGAATMISSVTGARVHALYPDEPHNVVLDDDATNGGPDDG